MVLNSTRVRQLTSLIFEEKFQFKNFIRFQIYNYKDIALQMQPTQFLFHAMQPDNHQCNYRVKSVRKSITIPYEILN
jgi:hypothetical protein